MATCFICNLYIFGGTGNFFSQHNTVLQLLKRPGQNNKLLNVFLESVLSLVRNQTKHATKRNLSGLLKARVISASSSQIGQHVASSAQQPSGHSATGWTTPQQPGIYCMSHACTRYHVPAPAVAGNSFLQK